MQFENLPKRTHIAIMKKSWGLIPKILSGEKTIESRWYKNRVAPWDRVAIDDIIYFKDSGEPVTVRARVTDVEQRAISNDDEALTLMEKYSKNLGVAEITGEVKNYILNKKYAIFVRFNSVEKIKPFEIDKIGFGAQAAWLVVGDIEKVKQGVY